MLVTIACLKSEHSLPILLLAVLLCLTASFAAMGLLKPTQRRPGAGASVRLVLPACVIGVGIWATHFVAMLAYRPHVPIAYDRDLTALSLGLAVTLVAASLWVAKSRLRHSPALGGTLLGAAVGITHYVGMSATRAAGVLSWDRPLVVGSILIGTVLGALALTVAVGCKGVKRWLIGSLLLTASICGLHFTGMGAVVLTPESGISVPAGDLSGDALALGVGAAAAALIVLCFAALLLEQWMSRQQERRMVELADSAVEGLMICQSGTIVTANASLGRMLGLSTDKIVGLALADLLGELAAETCLVPDTMNRCEGLLSSSGGEKIPVELIAHPMPSGGRRRVGVAVRDLRDRIAADSKIQFMAHHDPLTGVLNRAGFHERLDAEFRMHRRKGDHFALMCLDLDRFKQVNDAFGHAAGDSVLETVCGRIGPILGEGDVLARLGGDEFAVICLPSDRKADLAQLGEQIIDVVSQAIDLGDQTAEVGVSIGIALFPDDGADARELMRNADAALYRAKAEGRGVCRYFESEIGEAMQDRQALAMELRNAMARDELLLVYQPQASIADRKVFGFEALVRWINPRRGAVSPCVFIPIAEETGLIFTIGEWVLRTACAEAASWANPLQVAVNLSGVQLRSNNLAAVVEQILAETGLAPGRLEIEITESAMVQDMERALHTLRQIKALGVKVAMDDFGTGYSSLANLRAFPFDKIKIDQSFVRNADTNEQSAAIVRAVVGLGRGLNLTVLAEGIETEAELAFLTAEQCTEGQGYLFGRPSPIEAFAPLVHPAPAPLRANGKARPTLQLIAGGA